MCCYKNNHFGHKILDINDEEELKKENISIEESSKDFDENKNKLEELKNKIENEMINIDTTYETVDKDITKSYELKHENLIKEENELKDKLKNEVTKIKETLEINLSTVNNILKKCERILKGIKSFKEEENNMIKKLNYVSNINKKQKEINSLLQLLMRNLKISFNDNNIKYENYYFNGLQIPKNITFNEITNNSFNISWKIDDLNIINIDNKQIKYEVEMKKEKEKFKTIYTGIKNNLEIRNVKKNTIYEIRIRSLCDNIKSDYSQIYKIRTDFFDSIILNKNERKTEFVSKIMEWSGCKSMELIYRGTRDGMTSKDFHNKCDNKGKTICLVLNDKGNIFGGYSSIPWASEGGDKTSNDCFLFTLTNIYNIEPTKFPYYKERSVYHKLSYGPNFGAGSDLYFYQNFLAKSNTQSRFPSSYQDILGKGKSIFTGDFDNNNEDFILKELEIFELS